MLTSSLPDIASDVPATTPSTLQWVGMEGIAVPIMIQQASGKMQEIVANANVFVSLDSKEVKGVHMSRLHFVINQLANIECNQTNLKKLLEDLVISQDGISRGAKIELKFDLTLHKPALLSDENGFQSYPIVIRTKKNPHSFSNEFELTIPYSSTCPCSASLARQLYAAAIDTDFPDAKIDKAGLLDWVQSEAGSVATPHSQRSYAYIRFSVGDAEWPELPSLILQLEEVIGSPVQTAVKRIDEQEFARINATNLMFCEDAARRLKKNLEQMPHIKDYWFKVEHQESLHAHNAVVIDQKQTN